MALDRSPRVLKSTDGGGSDRPEPHTHRVLTRLPHPRQSATERRSDDHADGRDHAGKAGTPRRKPPEGSGRVICRRPHAITVPAHVTGPPDARRVQPEGRRRLNIYPGVVPSKGSLRRHVAELLGCGRPGHIRAGRIMRPDAAPSLWPLPPRAVDPTSAGYQVEGLPKKRLRTAPGSPSAGSRWVQG